MFKEYQPREGWIKYQRKQVRLRKIAKALYGVALVALYLTASTLAYTL